jgi:hypothetical protein
MASFLGIELGEKGFEVDLSLVYVVSRGETKVDIYISD